MFDYERDRYGSAGAASLHDLRQAGLLSGKGISFGFDENKRHELFVPNDGSVALFGGAGCGKSASAFANILIGGHLPNNFICFDPRGELAAISILALSLQGYELHFVNPTGMLGLPQGRCNPLDHLTINNVSLIADAQKAAQDFCSTPLGVKSSWTYDDARRWLTALMLFDAEYAGCASLTGVFYLVQSIQGDTDLWCDLLERMMESRFPTVVSFAGEIMALQKEGRESFTAPLGVLQSAFAFMHDPRLQWTFGGSDFSLQWLTDANRKIGVFVVWPIEFIQTQAPAIRQVMGSAIQNKLRCPGGTPVSVLWDEAGQCGNVPSLRELFTYGRGAGLINNVAAWQETSQIRAAFGPQADEIIGSAQFRVFKGVRTESSANMVSRMSGTMSLEYDALKEQSDARRLKQHAAQRILSGGNFFEAAADLRHYTEAETHRSKQPREVLKPDEVLNLPPSAMVAFASGLVEGPIMGHWINHYERFDFAGLYLNNPYHDAEHVSIKTRLGSRRARVIEERVPSVLAHLPQYQGGFWRYIEGCRPNV
ncbi:type IV secretory system conjugative DNA transfer family protein [Porticoccus sp. W117]|uniref:type IV secretory system conjugative DNA transfer family protein n=1 Tax=Porticoccus sp. W117 TaxID=3054777 RepID=UPI00259A976F|nr:type IV secretory system conjugative DNA transfer family protein [Porticoccus sp. W117]MDM3871833.1 type IV secretory system conjugative DNA transfer family protein [Porticoccus sp. W117]